MASFHIRMCVGIFLSLAVLSTCASAAVVPTYDATASALVAQYWKDVFITPNPAPEGVCPYQGRTIADINGEDTFILYPRPIPLTCVIPSKVNIFVVALTNIVFPTKWHPLGARTQEYLTQATLDSVSVCKDVVFATLAKVTDDGTGPARSIELKLVLSGPIDQSVIVGEKPPAIDDGVAAAYVATLKVPRGQYIVTWGLSAPCAVPPLYFPAGVPSDKKCTGPNDNNCIVDDGPPGGSIPKRTREVKLTVA